MGSVTRPARWPPWPRRSPSAPPRATCGCSSTRALPWPRFSGRPPPPAPAPPPPPDERARLVGAFGGDGAPIGQHDGRAGVVPGLVEPLSDRELQVLRLGAAGRSNREIADEAVVGRE